MSPLLRTPLLLWLGLGPLLSAADRYVSTSGTNSGAGGVAAPWRTIQYAASNAAPGDVVYVQGGTYREFVNFNVSGTATQPITFRNAPGQTVIVDPNDAEFSASKDTIFRIENRSYLIIQGFIIQGLATTLPSITPVGILISSRNSGTCVGIQLRNNVVQRIEQNSTDTSGNRFNYNAHGIKVMGRNNAGVSQLVIDGNEVANCKLGASEALVVNGNVFDFRITRNHVHHVNNIAIDVIGYEGTAPAAVDRARQGIISDNLVYDVDSSYNASYLGNPTTGGGSQAAAGIYIDGGSECIIERNHIHDCNFGIELASEESRGSQTDPLQMPTADLCKVRNNLIHHCHSAGVLLGGYASDRGSAVNNEITHNTLFENSVNDSSAGQVTFQHHCANNVFRNNIMVSRPFNFSRRMTASWVEVGGSPSPLPASNTFSYNLYFAPVGSPLFATSSSGSTTAQPDSAGGSAGNPQFVEPFPTTTSTRSAFKIKPSSPAVDTGDPAFVQGANELDLDKGLRINGTRVDRGAEELD
jgi:parallel beta-helix repeat protein